MKKYKVILIVLLLGLSLGSPALRGQMAGNPIGSRGEGEWTVSVLDNYFTMEQEGERAVSNRIFLKSNWGVTRWMDVYLMGGAVQLDMRTNDVDIIDFHGKYRLGYGLGFNLHYPIIMGSITAWAGGHALRFNSQGSFMTMSELLSREYVMDYDWREFQGHLGIILPYRFMRFYVAGIGWAVQRLDTKKEYLVYEDNQNYVGEEEGEYRSGLWTGGLAGIEFMLPHRYSISIEVLAFNTSNYQIMVGISQTGISW